MLLLVQWFRNYVEPMHVSNLIDRACDGSSRIHSSQLLENSSLEHSERLHDSRPNGKCDQEVLNPSVISSCKTIMPLSQFADVLYSTCNQTLLSNNHPRTLFSLTVHFAGLFSPALSACPSVSLAF